MVNLTEIKVNSRSRRESKRAIWPMVKPTGSFQPPSCRRCTETRHEATPWA